MNADAHGRRRVGLEKLLDLDSVWFGDGPWGSKSLDDDAYY